MDQPDHIIVVVIVIVIVIVIDCGLIESTSVVVFLCVFFSGDEIESGEKSFECIGTWEWQRSPSHRVQGHYSQRIGEMCYLLVTVCTGYCVYWILCVLDTVCTGYCVYWILCVLDTVTGTYYYD